MHLFQKNLSELSTGTYTHIIDGLDVFFEAVPTQSPCPTVQNALVLDVDKSEAGCDTVSLDRSWVSRAIYATTAVK
jgi:hypothetical protein